MSQVAAVGFVLFIVYLYWSDARKHDRLSISWAPLVWMFLAGSRWVSSWLNLSDPLQGVDAYAEGSPVDRLVFSGIIVWGIVVLYRRRIDWRRLFAQNWLIALYLLFCVSSVLWTDYPVVLVKRWFKDLGNPIIALVMLTELRPYEAVAITIRRLSFLLLPLSVLFIRYYPDFGRSYALDGSPMYTGVGSDKNSLGSMCLVTGMYFLWKILQIRNDKNQAEKADVIDFVLVATLVWLLVLSNSQTSTACLIASAVILLTSRVSLVAMKPSRIVAILIIGAFTGITLESTFHLKDQVFALMGRDATLTNRVTLWEVVRGLETNSFVGTGFMSFWAGERMQAIWDVLGVGINQAHNGYLEQYLNLGYVGVGFIIAIMLSGLIKIRKTLDVQPAEGMLRLCFLAAALMYNYTEASFYGISNMWVLLLVSCIDTSGVRAPSRSENRKHFSRTGNEARTVTARHRRRVAVLATSLSPRR